MSVKQHNATHFTADLESEAIAFDTSDLGGGVTFYCIDTRRTLITKEQGGFYTEDANSDEMSRAQYDPGAKNADVFNRANHSGNLAQSVITNLVSDLAGKQANNSDLSDMAALTPVDNDLIQRKSGHWVARTPAQYKTDLALVKADVGLGSVDNTTDANKPTSTAQQTSINTAISDLKAGVASPGDTLNKLYNIILGQTKEITVANISARDAYDVPALPVNIFVTDDGDTRWALYKATSIGVGASFVKLSDPDLLNAVLSASQIKTSYESNSNTNAFTDVLLSKLNGISAGATANDTDANLKARANHTGTQSATTIVEDSTHRFVTDANKATWDAKQDALGFTAENSANKNAANGYAGLNGSSKLDGSQVPYGATSTTACVGNDARLSDARVPTAHSHPESDLSFSDNTTNDASTAKHGLLKKLSNVATEFMNGQGAWVVPSAPQPNLPVMNRVPSENIIIPANYSSIVSGFFECVDTFTIECANGAIMEVSN